MGSGQRACPTLITKYKGIAIWYNLGLKSVGYSIELPQNIEPQYTQPVGTTTLAWKLRTSKYDVLRVAYNMGSGDGTKTFLATR